MIGPDLLLRAARHGLSQDADGWWFLDVKPVVVRATGSYRGWWWHPPAEDLDTEARGPHVSGTEALSALLDWLDTQNPPPPPPTKAELEQLSLSTVVEVLCDSVEQHGLTEAAEKALGAALDANPDAAVRVVAALKAVGPWVGNSRVALGHDVRKRPGERSGVGFVAQGYGSTWVRRVHGVHLPGAFDTQQAAMAAVDAALLAEGRTLAGGPVLLETQPEEAQPEAPRPTGFLGNWGRTA